VDRGRRAARTPPIQFVSYFQIVNKPISRPLKRFYSPVPPHFMLIGLLSSIALASITSF
jgi:hypothetical protein